MALHESGELKRLLEKGVKYAFISNSDNLGATLDLSILGFMVQEQHDFIMETTEKTLSDQKGGTLVRLQNKLSLLESAQVQDSDLESFYDIERFKVFNTNNLWINLEVLSQRLNEIVSKLPIIINKKIVSEKKYFTIGVSDGGCNK